MTSKDAETPKWAKWIACDADGTWWAFEAEPHLANQSWYENEVGRYAKIKINESIKHGS